MINYFNQRRGRYLVVKKTFKRAIGQPNIKRNNRTTHIVCLSTETFPLTVVGEQVNYMGCFQRHSLKHQNSVFHWQSPGKLSRPGQKTQFRLIKIQSIWGVPDPGMDFGLLRMGYNPARWSTVPQGFYSYFKVNAYETCCQ